MNLDFNKNKDGLIPAIIQDNTTHKVLMLGYLNQESLSLTLSTDVVHFYSRTKQRIWKKHHHYWPGSRTLEDSDSQAHRNLLTSYSPPFTRLISLPVVVFFSVENRVFS